MEEMDFFDWINKIIEEYQKSGKSETQLAREIGISQATLNAWKNKTRGLPREEKIINALIEYFKDTHPEIYSVLNRPNPTNNPRSYLLSMGMPEDVVDNILSAREEYSSELVKRGIKQDSPEAREIVRKAFAKHGIQLTDTK